MDTESKNTLTIAAVLDAGACVAYPIIDGYVDRPLSANESKDAPAAFQGEGAADYTPANPATETDHEDEVVGLAPIWNPA